MNKSVNTKAHESLVKSMSNTEVSPAGMAFKMLHESRYVNESTLQYLINFIVIWGTRNEDMVPNYNKDTYTICKELYQVLQQLGLTNSGSR